MDLLLAPQNVAFSIALAVMLGIAAIEGVMTLFGAGLSGVLDSLVGDFDLDADVDLDGDAGVDAVPGSGLMTYTLGWLRVGKVPMLVLLVIFLTAFGLSGLALQEAVRDVTGGFLPGSLAWIPAFGVAIPSVRLFGGWIARIIPKDETSAVSARTFVGRVATVTLGTAAEGEPTQARLADEHGRSHYVMVEPDLATDRFETGEQVLLVRQDGARFRVIAPPTDAILNQEKEETI
ncbi:MAG: YqiJ family protein [Myxococcota bacterium]